MRGYYAMPLLWDSAVIGWANISHTKGKLDVQLGFVDRRPQTPDFDIELNAEVARMEAFVVSRVVT